MSIRILSTAIWICLERGTSVCACVKNRNLKTSIFSNPQLITKSYPRSSCSNLTPKVVNLDSKCFFYCYSKAKDQKQTNHISFAFVFISQFSRIGDIKLKLCLHFSRVIFGRQRIFILPKLIFLESWAISLSFHESFRLLSFFLWRYINTFVTSVIWWIIHTRK